MAPPSGLHQSAIPSDFETPFPQLVRSSTVPASLESHSHSSHSSHAHRAHRADPSHLAPEDAYMPFPPPRHTDTFDSANGSGSEMRPRRVRRNKDGSRSQSRRRKRFQKLLWVKQSYPDNYTDRATFLENLQRNPRVQPYDFWPLISDSTVIVQHVCSVIIFVVCFVGIFQERVSPVSVVGWGSFGTFVGWLLWDWWVYQESQTSAADGNHTRTGGVGAATAAARSFKEPRVSSSRPQDSSSLGLQTTNASMTSISSVSNLPSAASSSTNLLQEQHSQRSSLAVYNGNNASNLLTPEAAHSRSAVSISSAVSQASATTLASTARPGSGVETYGEYKRRTTSPVGEGRRYLSLGAIKSAVLIYFTLLGLSPILKSLTRSTSSDSIWAMSFWLLAINIFFFDYSGSSVGTRKVPVASLSTNAALMASTVLASRLPSTGQVFSLTLFSIEVFGLFPVFRQCARHRSWRYHVTLTVLLIMGAGGGVGMILGADDQGWPWKNGLLGVLVGCLITALAMGGCSWWLIGLQKYKNEIYGPWDPARPIIISRRHWDED
ncbi:phosphatidylinositol N-acetylglucosaminyltransferase-domain-containing protein [Bombardia bombarda]|uniref:Phosphatidylinositol N-acetylglucosaminyltransferase-domain-containing protein n=1 Tax=Bombardia bombarda TaxID=252184 RepID=A0AA39X7B4_9PEZI|nr:phosphatidylinositol N-acetylglucosaminyltransferase-domain-containing protein [Bombardia bombarda]